MFPAGIPHISTRRLSLATGIDVRVVEAGPAAGAPLVMLHGWGESVYAFRHAFDALPPHGIRAIAPDLRGFGLSDKPARGSYALERYLEDLDALLDALALDRVALLAHSMGGAIALRYALQRRERVRALALVNPTGLVRVPIILLARALPRFVARIAGERLVPRGLVRFVLRQIAFYDESCLTERDVDEYWAATQQPGFVRAIRSTASEFDWSPLSDDEARAVTQPCLLVLGTKDRLVPNAVAAAHRLPRADVRVLEGGHCVHEEQPLAVYQLIAGAVSAA